MSPKAFTFKLTVPKDPQVVAIVADVAAHAVTYAELNAEAGAGFVERVRAAAAAAMQAPGGPASCHIEVTSDATSLTFTIGTESVSAHHST
ncbi:MAG: hypothetical protein WC815_11365 [Vicinamibacterales bacterium]|jgi:hypothetical protein